MKKPIFIRTTTSTVIFILVICFGVTGCASSILYKNENLTIQQPASSELLVQRGAKAVSSAIEESSGIGSSVKVFAPIGNELNLAVVRYGKNKTKFQAIAWPHETPSPCMVEKNAEDAQRSVDFEWATPVAFSVVDNLNREVYEVVSFDESVPGWVQIYPNSRILKACPLEAPLKTGEYDAGSIQVLVGTEGKALFVTYNSQLYRIKLDTPIEEPVNSRVSVSPSGKIPILAIIDGLKNNKRIRMFAWSSRRSEPMHKSVTLNSSSEVDVRWLSNRSVSISSEKSDIKVVRYNLDRSWSELSPRELP